MTAPTEVLDADERSLLAAARQAASRACCHYSGFAVGAALLDRSGEVWTGANVENASYTLGLCAERVALFYALTHGGTEFAKLVIATDTEHPTSPCGACRQVLCEYARNCEVVMVARDDVLLRRTVAELMPDAFDGSQLEPG